MWRPSSRSSRLLHDEGFTIAGARKALAKGRSKGASDSAAPEVEQKRDFRQDREFVKGIKEELVALKELLEKD